VPIEGWPAVVFDVFIENLKCQSHLLCEGSCAVQLCFDSDEEFLS